MDNHIEPLSPYTEELPPDAKNDMDPFISGRIGEITEVPPVDACDLVLYLVLQLANQLC